MNEPHPIRPIPIDQPSFKAYKELKEAAESYVSNAPLDDCEEDAESVLLYAALDFVYGNGQHVLAYCERVKEWLERQE